MEIGSCTSWVFRHGEVLGCIEIGRRLGDEFHCFCLFLQARGVLKHEVAAIKDAGDQYRVLQNVFEQEAKALLVEYRF